MHGSDVHVGDVQGDLGNISLSQPPANALIVSLSSRHVPLSHHLDSLQSPGLLLPPPLLSEVEGDLVRLLLGGEKVHVVGDEELPHPGHSPAPAGNEHGGSEVRGPAVFL